MRNYLRTLLIIVICSSCTGEVKQKLKRAKQGVSNVTTIAEKAKEANEDIENLKDAIPLTNEELKEWLPESLEGWQRSGFKVGITGYMNVAAIEGTYKTEEPEESGETDNSDAEMIEKKLTFNIIDGAGPSGSMMIVGLGMASEMDMEQEDEWKHTQSIEHDGILAQQTFHKKKNETAVQFVYENRFGVIISGQNLNPDETWRMIEKLDLRDLVEMTE